MNKKENKDVKKRSRGISEMRPATHDSLFNVSLMPPVAVRGSESGVGRLHP